MKKLDITKGEINYLLENYANNYNKDIANYLGWTIEKVGIIAINRLKLHKSKEFMKERYKKFSIDQTNKYKNGINKCGFKKGYKHSDKFKQDRSKNFKGNQLRKGCIPWNKELKGKYNFPKDKYPNFGMRNKNVKIETKIKIGLGNKGKIRSDKTKLKYSFAKRGIKFSEEHRKNISLSNKGKKLSKEHIRKILQRKPMSSLEIKFNQIINKYNLPYKFVGNGDFFIERKNPDFINTNGKKIAIEVYYKKHKELFKGSIEQWKQERQEIFNKYGWYILFFDETQVNDEIILNFLGGKEK